MHVSMSNMEKKRKRSDLIDKSDWKLLKKPKVGQREILFLSQGQALGLWLYPRPDSGRGEAEGKPTLKSLNLIKAKLINENSSKE